MAEDNGGRAPVQKILPRPFDVIEDLLGGIAVIGPNVAVSNQRRIDVTYQVRKRKGIVRPGN